MHTRRRAQRRRRPCPSPYPRPLGPLHRPTAGAQAPQAQQQEQGPARRHRRGVLSLGRARLGPRQARGGHPRGPRRGGRPRRRGEEDERRRGVPQAHPRHHQEARASLFPPHSALSPRPSRSCAPSAARSIDADLASLARSNASRATRRASGPSMPTSSVRSRASRRSRPSLASSTSCSSSSRCVLLSQRLLPDLQLTLHCTSAGRGGAGRRAQQARRGGRGEEAVARDRCRRPGRQNRVAAAPLAPLPVPPPPRPLPPVRVGLRPAHPAAGRRQRDRLGRRRRAHALRRLLERPSPRRR